MENRSASALAIKYETAYGMVELSPETVSKYLARGNQNLTDQEIRLFIELCKFQRLNPFVGEAYAIKFGGDFQMVVGYDTYKRRAEENPSYRGRESGIVVLRGDQVITKKGTCLYPKETLLGGWCKVYREMNGQVVEEYKEVSLEEYDKKQANWKTKPCTMIEKVAVSQALRSAFPKDYTGLYTAEEAGTVSEDIKPMGDANIPIPEGEEPQNITKDERKELFDRASLAYGEHSVDKLKELIEAEGCNSTQELTRGAYIKILTKISNDLDAQAPQN